MEQTRRGLVNLKLLSKLRLRHSLCRSVGQSQELTHIGQTKPLPLARLSSALPFTQYHLRDFGSATNPPRRQVRWTYSFNESA